MTYRDDLAAAQQQNRSLKVQLDAAQQTIEQLRAPLQHATARISLAPTRTSRRAAGPRPASRLCFDPPRTYFPLWHLLRRVPRVALANRPRVSGPTSDSLLSWIGYLLAKTFVCVIWTPIYVLLLLTVVLPWTAIVTAIGSVLLLPLILLSRLRVTNSDAICRDRQQRGWLAGEVSDETAGWFVWVLLSISMPPLLPVFIPLLGRLG